MKLGILKNPFFIAFIVLSFSFFLRGDTLFLPLVISTGAAVPDEILIPSGTFQMGCFEDHNDGFACEPDELPLHPVYLDAYYIDKYEVTNAEYKACVTANDCTPPSSTTAYSDASKADYPVVYVSWHQAQAYCTWEGKRLPTEAEWEKAARGSGYPRTYPWGEAAVSCDWVNSQVDLSNCVGEPDDVGSYPAGVSPYGVHDMAGNVSEWVNDWYDNTYYAETAAVDNPQGPGDTGVKVLRSGTWLDDADSLRVPDRWSNSPGSSNQYDGFRCARSP